MKTILTIALCAISLGLHAKSLPKDTINRYVIDNVAIPRFDGTQLEGKTIDKYIIACKDQGKSVVRTHVITTSKTGINIPQSMIDECNKYIQQHKNMGNIPDMDVIKMSDCKNFPDAHIILNGKKINADEFKRLKPEDITNITVMKPGTLIAMLTAQSNGIDDKGKNGIILVTTKSMARPSQVIYINEKIASEKEMKQLKPSDIKSVYINTHDGTNEVHIILE